MTKPSRRIPRVRTRRKGQIAGRLENLANKYKEDNENREVRFVYDPPGSPELSKVYQRQAEGYEMVKEDDEPVRVGDTVMMSISKEQREDEEEFRAALSREERQRVQAEFEEAQEEVQVQSSTGETHKSAPTGSLKIEEKELEYDIEQQEGEQ